jgi:hypothetical protein
MYSGCAPDSALRGNACQPGPGGTGVQGGRRRRSGGDATGRDDGNIYCRNDPGEQREHRRRTADMPAGFHALGNHDVASGVGGGQRLIEGADLPEGERAAGVDAVHDHGIRIAPKHFDNAGAAGGELQLLAATSPNISAVPNHGWWQTSYSTRQAI